MKKRLHILFTVTVCLLPVYKLYAQSDSTKQPSKFTVKGYIKYLEQVSFAGDATQLLTGELLHNRLNFKYVPNEHLKFRLEVRNRMYYGQLVQNTPNFASYVTANNATLDLSKNWVNKNAILINSTIDRASIEYTTGKWDVTLGRQRINWGISTVWTPNDIFNTFNYFDFDYEERPGTDAARVQYAFNSSSSLDVAFSPGKTPAADIGAVMYHYNKWGYDFQLFSGVYHQNVAAGIGWAGNIKDAGFKGEISYFTPFKKNVADSNSALAASLSVDYGFKNGIYLLVSALYNNAGSDTLPGILKFTAMPLSAKNIFPFKYTMFAQVSYSFTPIFKASFAGMYSPASNSVILLPALSYSVADNWMLDFISQSFFGHSNGAYRAIGNSFYLRLKWGF
jgi:hypothetical protein